MIMPVSSASGTNSEGSRRPRPGWFQRTSASAALTSPDSSDTIGWYSTISCPRSTALCSSSFRPWRFSTASRMLGSNMAWRPLPDSFARYMARSAFRISSSASWLSCVVAIPIERWTKMISPAALTGCSNDFMMRSATIVALSLTERSSLTITANSSPPRRAIASSGRTRVAQPLRRPRPAARRPRRGRSESLNVLKSSRSTNSTATSPASASSAAFTWLANRRAVREVRERVVERLVVQLLLQRAQLVHRLLQAVVLERDARVVGERLEELQVLVGERADHAVAVGQHDRPDHAVLAGQHGHHRIASPGARRGSAAAAPTRTGGRCGGRAGRHRRARAARPPPPGPSAPSPPCSHRGRAWCAAEGCRRSRTARSPPSRRGRIRASAPAAPPARAPSRVSGRACAWPRTGTRGARGAARSIR